MYIRCKWEKFKSEDNFSISFKLAPSIYISFIYLMNMHSRRKWKVNPKFKEQCIIVFTILLKKLMGCMHCILQTADNTEVFSSKSTLHLQAISACIQDSLWSSFYDFLRNYTPSLKKKKTKKSIDSLNSFSYLSAKLWNALPKFIRTTEFTGFKGESIVAFLFSRFSF